MTAKASEKNTVKVYLNEIDRALWSKWSGLARMLDLTQKAAIEEALADWINKHRKDVVL
jgi:hypothetical protein